MGMPAAWAARQWSERWRTVRWPAFFLGFAGLLILGGIHYAGAPALMTSGHESMYVLAIALLLHCFPIGIPQVR